MGRWRMSGGAMSRQEATAVVEFPLPAVHALLTDVQQWPMFLLGLRRVDHRGSGRWTFLVHDGARPREVDVAVAVDVGVDSDDDVAIRWRALSGPRFEGTWTLIPDGDRTRVQLLLDTDPMSIRAGMAELLGPSEDTARHDLQQLQTHLAAV